MSEPAAPRRFHVRTFGCQMNEHDSERRKGKEGLRVHRL
jgi:tRNA A37 methylthiotransferase MiaB